MFNSEVFKLMNIFGQLSDMGIKAPSVAGEIGERMILLKTGGTLAKFNQKGFDVVEPQGDKHQVKTRVYYGKGKQQGTSGTFLFKVKDNEWDVLDMFVLDSKGNTIRWAVLTKEEVREIASVDKNGHFSLTFDLLDKLDLAESQEWDR